MKRLGAVSYTHLEIIFVRIRKTLYKENDISNDGYYTAVVLESSLKRNEKVEVTALPIPKHVIPDPKRKVAFKSQCKPYPSTSMIFTHLTVITR